MCSNFSDVFDEDHFINTLANDIKVIKKLPKEFANATRAVKHFRSWSGMDYYENEIGSLWEDYQVCFLECFFCMCFLVSYNHLVEHVVSFLFVVFISFFFPIRLFVLPSLILA